MIIVIADDITGAAELGGIAIRYGIDALITTDITNDLPKTDILIVATDTRSCSETEAICTIKHIMCKLSSQKATIFKKTDSVLRGHVVAEINTIISATDYKKVLLLPQNPSKGRIIKNGIYYIDGIKLNETAFRYDPEFPRFSASVKALLNNYVSQLKIDEQSLRHNDIYIADAENEDEINIQLSKADSYTLLAGGADFFDCIIKKNTSISKSEQTTRKIPDAESIIVICGSTQSKSLVNEPYIRNINGHEEIMPDEVFHGYELEGWIDNLKKKYIQNNAIIISIGKKENKGKEYAIRLRHTMAEATKALINLKCPDILVIEGGATAYAIIENLKWYNIRFKNEYTPGIVSMVYKNTEIILKPGSYPWDNIFT